MTSQSVHENDQQWQPCPSGEVAALVQNLRHQRRRRQLQKLSAAVCGLAVAGLIGLYAVPHPLLVEPGVGGIACSEVEKLADEYLAGRLDRDVSARVDEHLRECDHCRHFVTELRNRQLALLLPESLTQPPGVAEHQTLELIARLAW